MNRPLPANLEAERFVLGVILTDDEAMHGCRGVLTDEDFSLDAHKRIWGVMCQLYDAGTAVDRVTVAEHLRDTGDLDGVGGLSYLISLDDGKPALSNLDTWVRLLGDKATLRRVIAETDRVQKLAFTSAPVQDVLNAASASLLHLTPNNRTGKPVSTTELISRTGLERLLAPRRDTGLPLPWSQLQALTSGLHPGQLFVVAARPGDGKTSAAIQIAQAVADRTGVLIFSREMTAEQLFLLMVVQRAKVDRVRHSMGLLGPEERARMMEAATWLNSKRIYLDTTSATVPAMHATMRRMFLEHEIGLVVVDYLQLVSSIGKSESRRVEVGASSRALKLAALEFNKPILVLSQLTRENVKDNREPRLYDLRESGDIEQDADAVLFLHPKVGVSGPERNVDAILAKQREGPTGSIPLYFRGQYQRFDEVTEQ
jgi:replicative DNA helicase